ncbi:MAG: hypothetical protein HDR88_00540 [Bacteroides sp.]|nr:hypothetical protein [Bacteroides sp.]
MATKKKIKFDPDKDRVVTFSRDGEKLSEVNGELKADFYSGIEKMCYLSDEYCAFYKGKKMGILDSKGIMITPAEWESISKEEGELFRVSKKNKVTKDVSYGYINSEGKELFNPTEYTNVNDVHDGRIVVSCIDAGNKEGAFDLEGNMVIAPKYLRLNSFCNNLAVACEEKGKVGLIDLWGNWVLQPEYSSITGFNSNSNGVQKFSVIGKDGKYGLLDQDLNIIVEPKYENIIDFDDTEGLILLVMSGGKQGVVDKNGNWLIPAEYDRIYLYPKDHYMQLEKDSRYGLADMKGRIIVDDMEVWDLSFEFGLIWIRLQDGIEIRRADNTTIFKGKDAKIFRNIILVSSEGKLWGVINNKGEELLPQEFKLPAQFVNQVRFSDDLLNLIKDEKTLYINEEGEIKISLDTRGWAFLKDYAIIGKKDDYSIINHSGEIVAAHYSHVRNLGNGYFYINNEEENDPKILNVNNGEQSEIPARTVGESNNGLIKIQAADGNYGVVSIYDGKVILEPVYSQILLTADAIWGYLPKVK